MSVTNAISGLTAVGGMVLAGGGFLPGSAGQVGGRAAKGARLHSSAHGQVMACTLTWSSFEPWVRSRRPALSRTQALACAAVLVSAVNIGGGFTITQV